MSAFGVDWRCQAKADGWGGRFREFVDKAYEYIKVNRKHHKRRLAAAAEAAKKSPPPRQLAEPPIPWEIPGHSTRPGTSIEVCGDSEMVVKWATGRATCKNRDLQRAICSGVDVLARLLQRGEARPRRQAGEVCRHVVRELNKSADAACAETFRVGKQWSVRPRGTPKAFPFLCLTFDGSKCSKGTATGWCLWGAETTGAFPMTRQGTSYCVNPAWTLLRRGGTLLHPRASAMRAEAEAFKEGVAVLETQLLLQKHI